MKGKRCIFTSFPPFWREVTSWEVNLAIDTDFTLCVNSRLNCYEIKNKSEHTIVDKTNIYKETQLSTHHPRNTYLRLLLLLLCAIQRKWHTVRIDENKKKQKTKNSQRCIGTYCIPLQVVQTNVQKFVQTYCGPCSKTEDLIHGIISQHGIFILNQRAQK